MSFRPKKIAVFGLGSGPMSDQNKIDSFEIGKAIAESGHYLLTGMAKGITEFAAKGAKAGNGIVIGISPYVDTEISNHNIELDHHDIVINTGFEDRGRNVVSVRSCDAMIIINGNFGVLNEITNGVESRKPIVVLKNSGGVANIIEGIFKELKPDYHQFKVVADAKAVVPKILEMLG